MCRVHQLAPDILALRKGIEDAFPNLCRIEDRHVEDEHRIAGAPSAAACSTRVMPRSQTNSMNKLGDPASSAELAALRARFARIVPATWSVKPFLRSGGVGLLEVFGFHLCVSRAAVLIGCSSGESTYPPNRQMTMAIATIDIAVMAVRSG